MSAAEIVESFYKSAGGQLRSAAGDAEKAAATGNSVDSLKAALKPYEDQIKLLKERLQLRKDESAVESKADKARALAEKNRLDRQKEFDQILLAQREFQEKEEAEAVKAQEERNKLRIAQAKDMMEQEAKLLEMINRNTIDGIKAMGAAVKAENDALDMDVRYKQDSARKQYEVFWAQTMTLANQTGGELGAGIGMMAGGMKGMADIQGGLDPYTLEMEAAWNHYYDMEASYFGHKDRMSLITQAAAERDQAIERASANQRLAMVQNMAGMMAGVMYSLYQATGQQSEATFRLYQAAAIAETVISTYSAAQKAYEWGWEYGGPYAPALAIAMAAVAAAAGLARVAAISSQSISGGMTAAAPSGGGGYSYTQPNQPSWQPAKAEEKKPVVINIITYGNIMDQDKFYRETMPALKKALEDGAH
jgi:hypothetical protein